MANKYDLETIVNDVATMVKAKLPQKLIDITTEKGDSIALPNPDATNGYFIQSMNTREVVVDPYVWIGAVDAQSVPARGAVGKLYDIQVQIVMADEGADASVVPRAFRYLRALEEIFTENFASVRGAARMDLQSLVPVPLQDSNSERFYKTTGVQIKVGIA